MGEAKSVRIQRLLPSANTTPRWADLLIPASLIVAWFLVIVGIAPYLPLQMASWLTFVALLITPGYLLADLITWRMDIDWVERLALAFPLGVAILAVPGIASLLLHATITELTTAWKISTALLLFVWLLHLIWVRTLNRLFVLRARQAPHTPWALDEIIMLIVLAVAFVAVIPTLSLYKIDGDAYAVNSFAADALAGLPLNATEPLFGTGLGTIVRMVLNQTFRSHHSHGRRLSRYDRAVGYYGVVHPGQIGRRRKPSLWTSHRLHTISDLFGGPVCTRR
jgi:hypothetical protein